MGSNRYKDMVYHWHQRWENGIGKPENMDEEEWAAWDVYWDRADSRDRSAKNKDNRACQSEKGGKAVHHLGRKSTAKTYYQTVSMY